MKARHRNDGLRKVCDCQRRGWAKCPHPWHVNIQHQGTSIRKSLNKLVGKIIKSKTDAENAFDAYKVALRNGAPATASPLAAPMTLTAMLKRYHRDVLSRRSSSVNTDSMITAITRTSLPHGGGARLFGQWPASEVDEAALWAYRTAREVKTVILKADGTPTKRAAGGAVTVNRDVQLLRRAFNWALAAMPADVKVSPFKAGKPPRGLVTRELPRSRRLQGDEAERLLAAAGASLRPLVEAALETGCRLGELLGLQWRDVDLVRVDAEGRARPQLVLPAAKTKTKKDRHVPISSRLKPILEMRRNDPDGNEHEPDAHVFGHVTGERQTTIKTAWRLALKRAKIAELHFHDLRREAASRWLDAGIRLNAVSKLLGHSTTEQTATYLACLLGAEHDAIAAYDEHRERRLQDSASGAGTGVGTGAHGSTIGEPGLQESSANHVIH